MTTGMYTDFFTSLAEFGIYPITTTYDRFIVSIAANNVWVGVRGTVVAALAMRRFYKNDLKIDHCWRFIRLFELYYTPRIPQVIIFC